MGWEGELQEEGTKGKRCSPIKFFLQKCKWKRTLPQGAAKAEQDLRCPFWKQLPQWLVIFLLEGEVFAALVPRTWTLCPFFLQTLALVEWEMLEIFLQETGPSCTLGHTSLGWAPVCRGRGEGSGGGALTERRTHRGMTEQGWTALPNSPGKERQEEESWQNS